MDAKQIARIRVPWYAGIRPNERGAAANVRACALDVETVNGNPYCFGFMSDDAKTIRACTARGALPAALELIRAEMCRHGKPFVVVGSHYNRFDLGVLLYPHLKKEWGAAVTRHGRLHFGPVEIEYFYGTVCFAKIRYRKQRAIWFDTFRFFGMSLDAAGEAIGVNLPKLPKPAGLGTRRIPLKEITPYLLRDIEICHALVKTVLDWNDRYDLNFSISQAQLSMRVLRHVYVKQAWHTPPRQVTRAALFAYHGGKNGWYVPPGWYRVKLLDINSAYPWAMCRLPSLTKGRWIRSYQASRWGFYCLCGGSLVQGSIPLLYDHAFRPLPDGELREHIWVTGMELQAALSAKILDGAKYWGYEWRATSADRPMKHFVKHFWNLRRAAKSEAERYFYKILINACYGKTIAREDDGEGHDIAGAQFYPVAGAWITALVRVRLWEAERKYSALHSATDGIMVPIETKADTSKELGEFKDEGRGWVCLIRNKMYLFIDDRVYSEWVARDYDCDPKSLWLQKCIREKTIKCALHGFQGSLADLVGVLRTGDPRYRVPRLMTWRESALRGSKPFTPDDAPRTLRAAVAGLWPAPCPS